MKEKQYQSELTIMSGIAILFVLAIHGCGSALGAFYSNAESYASADLWLRVLSNLVAPAVPMFLFVSGYKYALRDFETPYVLFLKKRLPRVIVSFTIINTIFWALDSIKYIESFNVILLTKTYLASWMGYSVAYQLWYIPMYCFVIMLCPLVRRVISSTIVRFSIFAVLGIAQRVLEVRFPVLATYPIRFVSYPVFFELGMMAQENDWKSKITTGKTILVGGEHMRG